MSVLKSISGHTGLARCRDYLLLGKGDVRAYFEGAGRDRCIAKDFLNLNSREALRWDEVMDETRREFENDGKWGDSESRTYSHFIISPNPEDGVGLDTLRELAMRWSELHFGFGGDVGAAQVAIFYHDDNSERVKRGLPGIPHAHIIVNNTNLETGKRLHFSNAQVRALGTSLCDISRELGLSYFEVEELEHDGRTILQRTRKVPSKDKPGAYDRRPSAQEVYRTQTERKLASQGKLSWKEELRENIKIACNLATDMDGLREALAEMGIVTELRRGKRALPGELLFYYPNPDVPLEQNKRKVSGQRLGRKFTPDGLSDQMKLSYYQRLAADDRDEARVISLVSDINTFHLDAAADIDLVDVSRAFAAISEFRIQNVEDARDWLGRLQKMSAIHDAGTPERSMRDEQIANVEALLKVAGKTDLLPESESQQKSVPANAEQVRGQRRAESGGRVSLAEKVDKGWRLTKSEYNALREKDPMAFARWKRNRQLAKEGVRTAPPDAAQLQKSQEERSDSRGKAAVVTPVKGK